MMKIYESADRRAVGHRHPVQLGDLLAHMVRDRKIVAVGSSDLTHYGEERFFFAPRGTSYNFV